MVFVLKKIVSLGSILLAGLVLVGCSGSPSKSSSSSSAADKSSSSKVSKVEKASSEKASSVTPSDDAENRTWTYKNDVFDAGIETYKFTKSEIRDSVDEGKKVLVLYCNVTNNSTKEQDPSNIYMVALAYQKNDTSNVQLNPGMVASDENGNSPIQKQEDGLNNKLLPGKTVEAVITFELNNDNPVTLEFTNASGTKIGEKVYQVK